VFADPDSDFLTLLASGAQRRTRRRRAGATRCDVSANELPLAVAHAQWRDIHRQLADAVEDDSPKRGDRKSDDYPRSIARLLSGLLGQIAQRQERNTYKASGDRVVTLFPGSNLYERREKPRKGNAAAKPDEKSKQPPWMVAGEIVETSQLFARMVAGSTRNGSSTSARTSASSGTPAALECESRRVSCSSGCW